MNLSPPQAHEIEVNIFGPGHGECLLIHLGGGNWIVVDSCLEQDSGQPAAIEYLRNIGIDPSESITSILITHWHDDHIAGIANIVKCCPNATVIVGLAQTKTKFISYLSAHDQPMPGSISSGVREYMDVLRLLRDRSNNVAHLKYAVATRRIHTLEAANSGHGYKCEVWALSPSDRQIDKFFEEIGSLISLEGATRKRASNQGENHLSVASLVCIGPLQLLLGADLESTSDPYTGWSPIIPEYAGNQTCFFKIAHHGSENADNEEVWRRILTQNPMAITTPFTRGKKKLPSEDDRIRILGYTNNAYVTSTPQTGKPIKRKRSVEKSIKEVVLDHRRANTRGGHIRLRCRHISTNPTWDVKLMGNASHLANIS